MADVAAPVVSFFVPGKPQPQGSMVRNRWKGVRDSNLNTGPWRERVALRAHEIMTYGVAGTVFINADGEVSTGIPMMVDMPVTLGLEFVMHRPVSTPKRRTPPAIKKPDLDKCIRAVCDALTGICYADDSQVTVILSRKRLAEIGEEPGVQIWVEGASDD